MRCSCMDEGLLDLLTVPSWAMRGCSLGQARVGPLINETKCYLVSFSLLLNQTKWHSVLSSTN